MSQQIINVSSPNDGLGDTLRNSQIKSNDNFTELYNQKVDKITGKGLSDTNFTQVEKDKLALLDPDSGVQADWNETDPDNGAFILNKPVNTSDFVNDGADGLNPFIGDAPDSVVYARTAGGWVPIDGLGEPRIAVGDANVSIGGSDSKFIAFTAITADRQVFLPPATAPNQRIRIADESFHCGGSRRILIVPDGSDTISGGINSVINFPGGSAYFESNGSGKWTTLSTTAIQLSAGVSTLPTITDNGDGSLTIGNNGVYVLFANADGSGRPKAYSIAGGTATMVDGSLNYIVAKYDPITATTSIFATTNFADVNHISSIQIVSVYRQGLVLFVRNNDKLGLALSNKLQRNAELTGNIRVNSGTLLLSESATRIINVSAGTAWIGGNEIPLASVVQSGSNCFFVQQTAPGVWTTNTLDSQYRNTQYNPASGGLSTLSNGRYAVIFVFRSLGQGNNIAYVLGQGDYNLGDAQLAKRPTNLPLILTSQMLPVGRIIIQKNAATATQIDKISDESYAFSGVTDHEALTNLLGGAPNDHQHLTTQQVAIVDSVYGRGAIGDADVTMTTYVKELATSVAFTAARQWTLPNLGAGSGSSEIIIADEFGAISGSNTLTIRAPSGKKLNGVTNGTEVIMTPFAWRRFITDGSGNWFFDAGIVRSANITQITITTSVSITTDTLDALGKSQFGRHVIINNGVNNINITVNGVGDLPVTYQKEGTGTITFLQGLGRTLRPVDGTAILNGAVGSTASLSSFGTIDSLRISNA